MSSWFFQKVIEQVKGILNVPIGVVDKNASIVACNEENMIGNLIEDFPFDKMHEEKAFSYAGISYKPFGKGTDKSFMAFVTGDSDVSKKYAELIAVSLFNTKNIQDEKHDKCSFVKSIVLDNILPGDVYLKAHELNFDSEETRVCMIVKTKSSSRSVAYDVVSSLFPDSDRDFVISINETDLVLVKEIKKEIKVSDLEKLAGSICDTLSANHYTHSVIGIGSIVNSLKDLANSFKEAQIALEIGKIFETERSVITYERLGIARLIYQVPTTMCKMFLDEVFKKGSIDALDQETLFTIQTFFDNNLNVSETSRKLFVHRNTLVYRLEKIHKITGLDLRKFDNAILFKVAMMVNRYLADNPIKY